MKFCAGVFSLFALGANAFTVQPPTKAATSLSSTRPNVNNMSGVSGGVSGMDYGSSMNSPAAPMSTSGMSTSGMSTSGMSTNADRRGSVSSSPSYSQARPTKSMFDEIDLITVQGGSLKTCSFNENVDRVSIFMKTEGRPLNANVDLWQGPDNTPQQMAVYLEDGSKRPFRAIIETPGSSNSVSIRNTAQLEYPLTAGLELDMTGEAPVVFNREDYRIVQGGAVYTTPFSPAVQSVRVSMKTDGRPMNARIELLQGPNNDKQVLEIYTEDGLERPFNAIVDTPGVGNVIRIVNTATVEFPLTAALEPYIIDEHVSYEAEGTGMVWR